MTCVQNQLTTPIALAALLASACGTRAPAGALSPASTVRCPSAQLRCEARREPAGARLTCELARRLAGAEPVLFVREAGRPYARRTLVRRHPCGFEAELVPAPGAAAEYYVVTVTPDRQVIDESAPARYWSPPPPRTSAAADEDARPRPGKSFDSVAGSLALGALLGLGSGVVGGLATAAIGCEITTDCAESEGYAAIGYFVLGGAVFAAVGFGLGVYLSW
jgi:hypothetical protein